MKKLIFSIFLLFFVQNLLIAQEDTPKYQISNLSWEFYTGIPIRYENFSKLNTILGTTNLTNHIATGGEFGTALRFYGVGINLGFSYYTAWAPSNERVDYNSMSFGHNTNYFFIDYQIPLFKQRFFLLPKIGATFDEVNFTIYNNQEQVTTPGDAMANSRSNSIQSLGLYITPGLEFAFNVFPMDVRMYGLSIGAFFDYGISIGSALNVNGHEFEDKGNKYAILSPWQAGVRVKFMFGRKSVWTMW